MGRMSKEPLTDAQRELAGRPEHLALARALAARFARRYPERWTEDIAAAAMLGLIDAARMYVAGPVKFTSYATHRIVGAMRDCVRVEMGMGIGFRRTAQKSGESVPKLAVLSTPVSAPGDRLATLADVVPSREGPIGWELESEDRVLALSQPLHTKQAEAVRLFYLDPRTPRLVDVGAAMGVSEGRASQLLISAAEELRAEMEARE